MSDRPLTRRQPTRKYARARRAGAAVLLTLFALLASFLTATTAQAHHAPNYPAVNVQPPFVGAWDVTGEGANNHHIVMDGDWAVDLYAPAGTAVQARAWPVSEQGAVAYYVADVRPNSCGNPAYWGGKAVKVEFWYAGYNVGHAWYLHLDNVPVSGGQWIGHGATLGYTAQFPQSPCYDVGIAKGVHTHFELTSTRHWACYLGYAPGDQVAFWGVIGRIGGDYAHGVRTRCP